MSEHAAELVGAGSSALTHCNTGALATGGVGTALGALREAWARGASARLRRHETRPLLQGRG
jgi:methylthioribose-1-phosphate isomerase